ncbi:MAG: ATP-binding protein [Deltaproteobacteria bacterium]|nr:ATP-binding protein [Deltaproteobacteria bacterium]
MRFFINQKESNNINILDGDISVAEASSIWGKEDLFKKSSVDLRIFKTPFGSISLLYGPRQIGKTSSLKLFLSQLEDSQTILFTDCSAILNKTDLYQHLFGLIAGKTTIVLDEVQEVEGWHLALRSLHSEGRLKECRIWCTGSEARYLIESGERLPGRRGEGKTVFARPWSFREFMDFFHRDETIPYRKINFQHINQRWLGEQRVDWSPFWQSYCLTGGVPKAVGTFHKNGNLPDTLWRVYVDWILGSWSKMRTPERSLSSLARRLCETLNSRVGYESLKKGTDIQSANTIKTLLNIQEDHFSIRVLPRYDLQRGKFLPSKLKKIYPLDPFMARVFAAIGWNLRRLYDESLPPLRLDECAFLTQMTRWIDPPEVSYLYSEKSQSEVDFYFEECGFELKSAGDPTAKQREILKLCPHAFVLTKEKIPLMAYLIGEERGQPLAEA